MTETYIFIRVDDLGLYRYYLLLSQFVGLTCQNSLKNGQYLFLNQGKFWSIHATVHVVGIYLQVFMHNKKNL